MEDDDNILELDHPVDEAEQDDLLADDEADEQEGEQGDDAPDGGADDGHAVLRQQRAHIRKLERELRAARKPAATTVEKAGPRPAYGDGSAYDFTEAKFDAALDEWDAKREAEIIARVRAEMAGEAGKSDAAAAVRPSIDAYYSGVAKLPAPDAEAVLADMEDSLSPAQQMALVLAAANVSPDNPAGLVYRIARDPDTLDRIAGIENPIILATEIAKMASAPSRPKPAIDRPSRGGAAVTTTAADKQLAKLEAEALRTGNRTALIRYRREIADKRERAAARGR